MNVPVLETERLILRPLTVADAQAEFEWLSDPRVTKFMPYNTYTCVEDVENWLKSVEAEEEEYHFGFVRKSDSKLIGAGSIGPNDGGIMWEFGYNIRYDCWNQGYATEATHAMIAFARDEKGVTLFGANHAVDNPASGKVMQKCGLHFERDDEYSSFDGLRTYAAKRYAGTAEDTRNAEKTV